MWTPQEVQAANDAYRKAISAVNATAQRPFLDNRNNSTILMKYLRSEQIDAAGYFYPEVWQTAIISCSSQLEQEAPKMSAEEIARSREARDRKDGRTFRDDSEPTTRQNLREVVQKQSEAANGFLNRLQKQKQFEERRQIPSAEATPAQLKALNSEELKLWLARYRRKPEGVQA
jgi:hypothetical protein